MGPGHTTKKSNGNCSISNTYRDMITLHLSVNIIINRVNIIIWLIGHNFHSILMYSYSDTYFCLVIDFKTRKRQRSSQYHPTQ